MAHDDAHHEDAHHGHDAPKITADRVALPAGHPLRRLLPVGGAVGALALVATFALGLGHPHELYSSYLLAFFYWLTLALGGLFFVLLQFATRAGWSVVVRRVAEHVSGTLPLFALLFVPLALAVGQLYHWSEAGAMDHDPLLAGKAPYLNEGFFITRGVFFVLAWSLLGWWFRRRSMAQDTSHDPGATRFLQSASAPALIVFAVTLTFASFDWVMSLDPHWYSTIFGVYIFAGCAVAIFSLVSLLSMALEKGGGSKSGGPSGGPLAGLVTVEHYHDLGKLLFGFVVFWAYIAFSQFMLIWYSNIPEETVWYRHRLEHGWKAVTILLAVTHFAIPFFYLILRRTKRNRPLLAIGCLWMLAVHWLDLFWLIKPAVGAGPMPTLLDLLAFLGTGGLFLATLAWLMRKPATVPVGDPRLAESLSFENM